MYGGDEAARSERAACIARLHRPWRRAAGLALLALVLAGLLRLAAGARLEPAALTFANGAELATLDPAAATAVHELRVLRGLYEGLVRLDPATLEPLPGAAESWESSPDGLRWRFRLRADGRWSNGERVLAADFVAGARRLLDPRTASPWAAQLEVLAGARAWARTLDARGAPRLDFSAVGLRAEDERTLALELERPVPWLLELAAFPLVPLHRASVERLAREHPARWQLLWQRPENLVTNGPFRLAFRRVGDRLRLAKSPFYWARDEVALETIDALASEHVATMLNLYLTGEVAFVADLPGELVPRLRQREDFRSAPWLASEFWRFNVTRPPLDDARVRRALALAVERDALVRGVTKAGEAPLWSFVPPGLAGYAPAELAHPPTRAERLAEARELLAQAGYGPTGRALPPLEIVLNAASLHASIAEVIAGTWRRELGVETRLRTLEPKVFLDAQRTLDYDLARSSWIADWADPASFLEIFRAGGENNRTGWGDARYDGLLERARSERGGQRLATLHAAEALLLEELPLVPLYAYVTRQLVDPRLAGLEPNPLDLAFLRDWRWRDDAELARWRAARDPRLERARSHGPSTGGAEDEREAGLVHARERAGD